MYRIGTAIEQVSVRLPPGRDGCAAREERFGTVQFDISAKHLNDEAMILLYGHLADNQEGRNRNLFCPGAAVGAEQIGRCQ